MTATQTNPPRPLAEAVHRALVGGEPSDIRLQSDVRATWDASVANLLVDPEARASYIRTWRELLQRSPLPAEREDTLLTIDIPAETLCRSGVPALSDQELLALASQPDALLLFSDVLDGAIGSDDLGEVWWEPIERVARSLHPASDPSAGERDAPVTPAPVMTPAKTRNLRWYAAGLAALAATLLLAVGYFVGRSSGGREVALAARVTATEGELRGASRAVNLTVENSSDRRAFVTVVGLKGPRSPIHYEQGRAFVDLGPNQSRVVALPQSFDELTWGIVVLTPTPAGEAVFKAIEANGLPDEPTAARDRIASDLAAFGFTGAAVEVVRFKPAAR